MNAIDPEGTPWFAIVAVCSVIAAVVASCFSIIDAIPNEPRAGITQIHLPERHCPRPEIGQVLIVTVPGAATPTEKLRAQCRLVTGRTI